MRLVTSLKLIPESSGNRQTLIPHSEPKGNGYGHAVHFVIFFSPFFPCTHSQAHEAACTFHIPHLPIYTKKRAE